MKILMYNIKTIVPVKCKKVITINHNNEKKEHYNIKIGTKVRHGWEYSIGVEDGLIQSTDTRVELTQSNYILNNIYNKSTGEIKVDKRGNKLYYISEADYFIDTTDVLLFISLPFGADVLDIIEPNNNIKAKAINYYKGKIGLVFMRYLQSGDSVTIKYILNDDEYELVFNNNNGTIEHYTNLV